MSTKSRYRVFKNGRLLAIVDGVQGRAEAILAIGVCCCGAEGPSVCWRRYTAVLA